MNLPQEMEIIIEGQNILTLYDTNEIIKYLGICTVDMRKLVWGDVFSGIAFILSSQSVMFNIGLSG